MVGPEVEPNFLIMSLKLCVVFNASYICWKDYKSLLKVLEVIEINFLDSGLAEGQQWC